VLVLPSPNVQLHDAGTPVDSSVNVTSNGAVPDIGEAIKMGTGTVVAVLAKLYRSPSTDEDVPLGVVTRTSTCPAVDVAGVVAVISVSLTTVKLVTAVPPTVTAVAPVKPVPVMVIEVPVETGPYVGETPVTVGTEVVPVKVNAPVSVSVPPGAVMTTLAVPAVPAGEVAVISVSLTTVRPVAVAPPMVTAVAPVKPVPVMVNEVPPAVVPDVGEILVNVGAGAV
jgi:hypothetical protein